MSAPVAPPHGHGVASRPDIDARLAQLRPLLAAQWQALCAEGRADAGNCVLFFATSSGRERARVFSERGTCFDSVWARGAQRLRRRDATQPGGLAWLRAELACDVRAITWGEVRARLATTKRNYWRHGLAFDASLDVAILPHESAGSALLYDGRSPVATANPNNLAVHARRRFGRELRWPDDDAQPVWLFDTRAAFTDGVQAHLIEHEGRNRGYRRIKRLDAGLVKDVVQRATDYLARQVAADGSYHYGVFPCFDRAIPTYNRLRHASSTYALLEGWEHTREPSHKAAIDAALARLCDDYIQSARLPDGRQVAYLVDVADEVKLGGNAVCLLALCKHAELTGDRSRLPLLEQLALGILAMQDPATGRFVHVLNWPRLDVKAEHRVIYYDGEAAFGLMRLHALTGDPRWLEAVEKAFEHFIAAEHWRAHDHWLGYCVNELTRHRPDPRYYRFGLDNVRDHLHFVEHRITTFPTLLELMMAASKMIGRLRRDKANAGLLDGFDQERFDRALHVRARYLLSGHFWPELAMFFRRPDRILCGFFIRHHGFRVRIDDVEHYLSGLIAYLPLLRHQAEAVESSRPAPQAGSTPDTP